MLAAQGYIEAAGNRLEYRHCGPQPADAPLIVLLHEGLGCAAMWGTFQQRLSAETGAGIFAWSRAGYGASDPVDLPRPLSYMHNEAAHALPELLDAIGFREGMLLGHSDGASIAAIYAGSVCDERVRGYCLIAPHFFVEDISIASIEQAKIAYATTDLREKLARWHANVDNAFRGWNDAWLDPGFRDWNILDDLRRASAPVHIIQGAKDQYGTLAQVERAREACATAYSATIIETARHSPWREAPEETLEAIITFQCKVMANKERAT